MKAITIILGDQLFPFTKYYAGLPGDFFMCESYDLCTHFRYHKHKIIHTLASMRHFAQEVERNKRRIFYQTLKGKSSFWQVLSDFIEKQKIDHITIFQPEDHFFEEQFLEFVEVKKLSYSILENPGFLCSRTRFQKYVGSCKSPVLNTFYQQMRMETNTLMYKQKPVGGQWNFDKENRKKIPKNFEPLVFRPPVQSGAIIEQVKELVEKMFATHPGAAENFWLPCTRSDSLQWLRAFVASRLQNFGKYQDAIDPRQPFLYHSVISPMLNLGLLQPQEVISAIVKSESDLASVEGFVRQVLGWREFVRGIYHSFDERMQTSNFFEHHRKLNSTWYKGTTQIPPLDDAITKANEWGYCHHIERLMVIANIMNLAEIEPKNAYCWFMEMFVDSSDWVMGPNVFGMGLFSDGGIFATKPYISGSNYLLKMSNYSKGPWCEEIDGLYWRFIDKNREFFQQNHRMSMMVSMYEKIPADKKQRIFKAADALVQRITT